MNMQENSNKPLISVIVPVYNSARFLSRCIDSILGQTYGKLEVLLIDDGSADDSGKICEEYMIKDRRIKAIHKLNNGTVSARKCGLANAQGQLISFIDSDDWIDEKMYENMISCWEKNENPDLVSAGLIFEYPESNMQKEICDGACEKRYEREEIIEKLVPELICSPNAYQGMILTTVCSKLINNTVAKEAMVYMSENLTVGEDGAYVYFLITCCRSVYVKHSAYYHYEQHKNSQNYNCGIDVIPKLIHLKNVMTEGMGKLILNSQVHEQIKFYIWRYIYNIVKENFYFDMKQFFYLFPYARCQKGGTIIIYGAGDVGKSYMQCLEKSRFVDRTIWVDQNYKKFQEQGKNIISIEEAIREQYNYVVIALNDEKTVASVIKELIARGVPNNKLIWEKPVKMYLYD